jgi:hypothetical protein
LEIGKNNVQLGVWPDEPIQVPFLPDNSSIDPSANCPQIPNKYSLINLKLNYFEFIAKISTLLVVILSSGNPNPFCWASTKLSFGPLALTGFGAIFGVNSIRYVVSDLLFPYLAFVFGEFQ